MSWLTHFDEAGKAHMVDVSDKPVTDRVAVAEGAVVMSPETLALVEAGTAAKGDVLGIAGATILGDGSVALIIDVGALGERRGARV